jgi:hypothetical protein
MFNVRFVDDIMCAFVIVLQASDSTLFLPCWAAAAAVTNEMMNDHHLQDARHHGCVPAEHATRLAR